MRIPEPTAGVVPSMIAVGAGDDRRRDLAELMGLRSRSARWVAVYFGLAGIVDVIIEAPDIDWRGYILAMAFGGIAVAIVLIVDGDPLSWTATALAIAAQSVMVTLGCAAAHGQFGNANSVVVGTVSIISAILCIRGRWLAALLSILGFLVLVYERTSAIGADPAGMLHQWVQAAPVFTMAFVFALRMRPTAAAIYELRAVSAQEAAERAALSAALAERDVQLARLDAQARELLERISAGEALTDADVARARLVQARLRDGIRAPGLSTPELAAAIWAARERGVSVTVLDDRGTENRGAENRGAENRGAENRGPGDPAAGDNDADGAALDAVRRIVTLRLAEVGPGVDVTVRVLPPGRSELATMLIRDGDTVLRLYFDTSGVLT